MSDDVPAGSGGRKRKLGARYETRSRGRLSPAFLDVRACETPEDSPLLPGLPYHPLLQAPDSFFMDWGALCGRTVVRAPLNIPSELDHLAVPTNSLA